MSHPIHNSDVWAAVVWWSEFPELSKLWATGNSWLQCVMSTTPDIKIVGDCDPLLSKFAKLASLDLRGDQAFDATTLAHPLPATLKSLKLHISSTPSRPLQITDFPDQLTELTINITAPIVYSVLPQTLTSLTVMGYTATQDFWGPFTRDVISWLPQLQTLLLPRVLSYHPPELPELLPPTLTRLIAPCTVPPSMLPQLPPSITELGFIWDLDLFNHIASLPKTLASLTVDNQMTLTAEEVGKLPRNLTELGCSYSGADLSCFEKLPLRKWALDLNSEMDFQGDFPQLTTLAISGKVLKAHVPRSVTVLNLDACRTTNFTSGCRIREYSGKAINSTTVSEQRVFSHCIISNVYSTMFVNLAEVAMYFLTLTPSHLMALTIFISPRMPFVEFMKQIGKCDNLEELGIFWYNNPYDYYDIPVTCIEQITLPVKLTKLYIQGKWVLPNLQLPRSLTDLGVIRVDIDHIVLLSLPNLRALNLTFVPTVDNWSTQTLMAVLEQLPQRMKSITIGDYYFSDDELLIQSLKDYQLRRARYLAKLSCSKP